MDKKNYKNIKILLVIILAIILIIGIVFGIWYVLNTNHQTSLTCNELNGDICNLNQNCNGKVKIASDTKNCCVEGSCVAKANITNQTNNLPNVPWSIFSVHYERGFTISFENLTNLVNLADKYNVFLTILMHPEMVDDILADQAKINLVHEWQARGHEIGIHAQGCTYSNDSSGGMFLGPNDGQKYEQLVASYPVKTAHVAPSIYDALTGYGTTNSCESFLPLTVKYIGVGRYDGRSSISLKFNLHGRIFYELHVKAGHGFEELPLKYGQYNSLNSNEIYDYNSHGEPAELPVMEQWFEFLSEKDPQGLKRKTQAWIMENVVIPNNLVVDESTLFNSTDPNIAKCSQLIGEKVVEDVYWYSTTDIFNFGRCLQTGTYCFLEESCYFDSPNSDYSNYYKPSECNVQNINNLVNFKPVSELCLSVCGDKRCDRDELDGFNGPKRCDADCIIPKDPSDSSTCTQIKGTVCGSDEICSGKLKLTSDTKNCCVEGSCVYNP